LQIAVEIDRRATIVDIRPCRFIQTIGIEG